MMAANGNGAAQGGAAQGGARAGRVPWTREELRRLIPAVERQLAEIEATQEEVRPMPPMTREEAAALIHNLLDAALTRPLTQRECFLHGQLLAVFGQACWAEALGHKGRFYVIPESMVQQLVDEQNRGPVRNSAPQAESQR